MKFFKSGLLEKKWFAYTFALCSAVVLYLFLTHVPVLLTGLKAVVDFVFPVIVGFCIAYVLDPVAGFFQKTLFKKVKSSRASRNLSVFATIVFTIVLIVLFAVAIIPPIIRSLVDMVSNSSNYLTNIQGWLSILSEFAGTKNVDVSWVTSAINDLADTVTSYFSENTATILDKSVKIGTTFFNGILAYIIAIYFLADKVRLQNAVRRLWHMLSNDKSYNVLSRFLKRCNMIMYRFIWCDLIDALIVGVANAVFFAIVGMPFNAMISVVVAVTNLAPTFGPVVGCIIGCVILVLQNPLQALTFLIFTIILQTIDGYVLKPKMFGGLLGVPSVWILICIIVGGRIFGVLGILLAIPFAAITDHLYGDYFCPYLQKRRERLDQEESEQMKQA
jgi:predicted PurR-regulated permease PerM